MISSLWPRVQHDWRLTQLAEVIFKQNIYKMPDLLKYTCVFLMKRYMTSSSYFNILTWTRATNVSTELIFKEHIDEWNNLPPD